MTYAQRTDLVTVLGIIMVTLVILAAALPAPRPSTQPAIPVAEIPAAIGTASRETVSVGTASGKAVASRTGASGEPGQAPQGQARIGEQAAPIGSGVPTSTARPSAAPLRTVRARLPVQQVRLLAGSRSISGIATWYRWRIGQAAAGPRLRAAIGPRWRGRLVTVQRGHSVIRVRLTDFCGCPRGRVIDLDSRSFARLARLSAGIATVRVSW